MRHRHGCSGCGVTLYICYEVVQRDDCGAFCGNAHQSEKEYCSDCQESREDAVNAAMHEDDDAEEAHR